MAERQDRHGTKSRSKLAHKHGNRAFHAESHTHYQKQLVMCTSWAERNDVALDTVAQCHMERSYENGTIFPWIIEQNQVLLKQ